MGSNCPFPVNDIGTDAILIIDEHTIAGAKKILQANRGNYKITGIIIKNIGDGGAIKGWIEFCELISVLDKPVRFHTSAIGSAAEWHKLHQNGNYDIPDWYGALEWAKLSVEAPKVLNQIMRRQ